MKTLSILLMFQLLIPSQEELGLGLVQVDIGKTKEIGVFKNKNDKTPEKIIRLIEKDGDIVIEEPDYSKWLRPQTIWLDYSQFLFKYTQIQDNWIEVIINKETGEKRWILNSPTFEVLPWEQFLVENTTAIKPMGSLEIKEEPDTNAKTIRQSTDKDCFEALEIKGEWMRIKTNENLECSQHLQPVKTGWIRWKQNNQLNIEYFLSC